MERVLVTGGTGFLGRNMTRSLAESGLEVLATHLRSPPRADDPRPPNVSYQPLDLRRMEVVLPLVEEFRPDCIFHFAGQAYIIPSWADPPETFAVNFRGTLALLEAVRKTNPRCRFVFAGSGTEYGEPRQVPTPEDAPLLPTSPYATSKAAADLLCYQYFRSYGIPVFRLRIFGTSGVGKVGDVCNDFASQVAELERGDRPAEIRVGDLDKKRDLIDVADAVRAMRLIAEKGEPGEAYNVGSGIARDLRAILATLGQLSTRQFGVTVDPSRFRKVDEPVHLADISRLAALGWTPQTSFEEMLRRILADWRTRVAAPAR